MRPSQAPRKWLLAVLLAIFAAGLTFFLFRPLGTPSDLRDRVAAALSEWTGGSVSLSEPLRVRYFPPSVRGGLVLSDATKLPGVKTITAPDFKISLALPDLLLGNIRLSALRLDQPTMTLNEAVSDTAPKVSVPARLFSFLAAAPIETIRIQDGTIQPANGKPLFRKFDVRLNTRGQIGALEAMGSFVFKSEAANFSFDSGRIVKTEAGRTAPVSLKFTSAPLTARFSGTMRKGRTLEGDGTLEARSPNVRQFLTWIGRPLPDGESLKNAYASGDVHWSGTTLTFNDGTFGFDGNEAVGLFALSIDSRPRVEGTLAFDQLTLDPYLPSADMDQEPIFDWVLLKHLDADLRVSAGEVFAQGLELGHGGLTINAKGGKISSEIGGISVCGGEAEGRLYLDLSGPRTEASLNGSLANIVIEDCLQALSLGVPIEGSGTLKADVSTGGKTREELIRGLAGTIKITAVDGVVPIDFAALAPKSSSDGTGWSQDSWTKGSGTGFSSLDADCSLSAGHLWCQSCRMETSKGVISGAGGLDVAQQTLDWDLLMADSVAPPDTSKLVMKNRPRVTVNGTLSAPLIEGVSRPNAETGSTNTDSESIVGTPR